ncbi:GMC oxidoreductase [Sphaerobolus stellatus SS14]|uniref:GMC oxidoreductase n=1 Tax=Sphaerobolus stellatus (strain SS14) TaxID=990650 RepID=A0A0C9UF42_SPHS4|nr:GMC oxidoreductase [Sphaerobolus stellatus SS14]
MWPFSTSYPELRVEQVGVLLHNESKPEVADINEKATYDYIIVGGGTSGCVIASRLSEDPSLKILVVERGILADTWASRVPLLSANFDSKSTPAYKWKTVPQTHADEQEFRLVAGKALGGTSRINAMLYTRGAPAEWNSWSNAGRKGWSYKDMLPYFLRSERAAEDITGDHHGREGSWFIRTIEPWFFSFLPIVLSAASILNLPTIKDINDPSGPICGAALMHRTQYESGERQPTSTAFLPIELALERKERLKICTGTIVNKIDFKSEEEGISKAVGIYFESEKNKGKVFYAKARKEVIVAAGTFGSPHLLMLRQIIFSPLIS